MSDQVPVLTCVQVREDTIGSIVPGSIQGDCDKCGHRVWISRSGQTMMATQEIKIRCLECVMADGTPLEVLKKARAVPGASRELLNYFRGTGEVPNESD